MNEIDKYIKTFPKDIQDRLNIIRKTILSNIDSVEETIKYGMPTYVLKKKNIIHFAGYANHIGIYPTPNPIEHFQEKLKNYKTSKGAIQIPNDTELPIELIVEIIKYRLNDIK